MALFDPIGTNSIFRGIIPKSLCDYFNLTVVSGARSYLPEGGPPPGEGPGGEVPGGHLDTHGRHQTQGRGLSEGRKGIQN